MTKIQHDALVKFNQVSRQREICVEKEKKIKRYRSIAIFAFLASILLIVAYQLAVHTAFFSSINIDAFAKNIPGREYPFMTKGPISPLSFSGTPLFFTAAEFPSDFFKENFKTKIKTNHTT